MIVNKYTLLVKCHTDHYVLPSYSLTPWSRVLEKLTGSQLVKKFPTFYGTQCFSFLYFPCLCSDIHYAYV